VEDTSSAKPLALLIGSDQGMCGKLNEEVYEEGRRSIEAVTTEPRDRVYIVMGERMAGQFLESPDKPQEIFSLPSSVAGIGPAVSAVLAVINDIREKRDITAVHVFHAIQGEGQSTTARHAMLWPIQRALLEEIRARQKERRDAKSRSLPFYTLDRRILFGRLVGHFLYGSLFRALAASLAAENAARLAAMQGAEKNIDNQLDELRARYRQRRQMNITEELLDIVSGFKALEEKS
jgi:F-type H+-transporting ATPase subunit gamma